MKRPKLVEVTWLDHATFPLNQDPHLYKRYTVGYVIAETKKAITLAATWDEDGPSELTILGKALVERVRPLIR